MKPKPTELTQADRVALTSMTYTPGWSVLKHLMEQRVTIATVAMLEIAPTDKDRAEKLSTAQAVAYAMNAFCAELMKDIQYQVNIEMQEEETEPEEDAGQKRLRQALNQLGILKPEENSNGDSNSDPHSRSN